MELIICPAKKKKGFQPLAALKIHFDLLMGANFKHAQMSCKNQGGAQNAPQTSNVGET